MLKRVQYDKIGHAELVSESDTIKENKLKFLKYKFVTVSDAETSSA